MSKTNVTAYMEMIQELDPSAALHWSPVTGKWYVSSRVQISSGAIISGITEHRVSPEFAVEAHVMRMVRIADDEVLVTNDWGADRKHWRWGGTAWVDASDRLPVRV